PRAVCLIPALRFRSRSCFSMRVAPAGKTAGNAKNSPPMVGPYALAIRPANTVMIPPKKNRTAYSYHFVLRRADKSRDTRIPAYLSKPKQRVKAVRNQITRARMAALAADHFNCIISREPRQAYRRKAVAPAIIERASLDAYTRPSDEIVRAS